MGRGAVADGHSSDRRGLRCAADAVTSPDREDAESLAADQGAVAVIGNRSVREGATLSDSTTRTEGGNSLPFPATPSASVAGRTVQGSVYQPRATPRRLPDDAPNILIVMIDDGGPGQPSTFGGEIITPTMDPHRRGRDRVQPVSHHGAVLAESSVAADRAEPSPVQRGLLRDAGDRWPSEIRRSPGRSDVVDG